MKINKKSSWIRN